MSNATDRLALAVLAQAMGVTLSTAQLRAIEAILAGEMIDDVDRLRAAILEYGDTVGVPWHHRKCWCRQCRCQREPWVTTR